MVAWSVDGALAAAGTSPSYTWQNVRIVAGGFVPGIVFSTKQAGLAYVRTDIGGFYRWDKDANHWIPLTDWVGPDHGNYLGGGEHCCRSGRCEQSLFCGGNVFDAAGGFSAVERSGTDF